MYDNIENHLGLHKTLEVNYLVDHYSASLIRDESGETQVEGNGLTIDEALCDLDWKLAAIPVTRR